MNEVKVKDGNKTWWIYRSEGRRGFEINIVVDNDKTYQFFLSDKATLEIFSGLGYQ